MNNQITILDRNNQSINVDLICYFSTNNKKYIFYNKNEIVQDGLIKMYVSEENMGLNSDISLDDWNNLKKIMQGIITGNAPDIQFLPYSGPIIFNEPKAIALNDLNINTIKSAYKIAIPNNDTVLNKDILSQNFGNDSVTNSEPVQISPIPNVQNTFNMESTPVNLNLEPVGATVETATSDLTIPSIEPQVNDISVPNIEPIMPTVEVTTNDSTIPSIEPQVSDISVPSVESTLSAVDIVPTTSNNDDSLALNINSIKPGGIDSGFKVSNEPNIFDSPISQEEINNPIDVTPKVEINSNNDTNTKKIELNNKKIKLFEELANIYREENELLSSDNNSNDVLENTASNLFNNNGTLNDSIIN